MKVLQVSEVQDQIESELSHLFPDKDGFGGMYAGVSNENAMRNFFNNPN